MHRIILLIIIIIIILYIILYGSVFILSIKHKNFVFYDFFLSLCKVFQYTVLCLFVVIPEDIKSVFMIIPCDMPAHLSRNFVQKNSSRSSPVVTVLSYSCSPYESGIINCASTSSPVLM